MKKNPNIQNSKNPNKLEVKSSNKKIYDLEERFNKFFERVARLCKKCPLNARTNRVISQLIAAAGSIAANYAEASEAMSKKDFIKSIKISRKEAKESRVWLKGLKIFIDFDGTEFDSLIQETTEFVYILTSILKNTDKK